MAVLAIGDGEQFGVPRIVRQVARETGQRLSCGLDDPTRGGVIRHRMVRSCARMAIDADGLQVAPRKALLITSVGIVTNGAPALHERLMP